MSILPAELSTGTVHGRFIVAVIDGDDADQEPEVIPATGRIVFKASVGYIPVPATNEGPVTVMKGPITGVLDSEGYLSTPHPTTGEPMYRGVKLLATDDPDMAVTDWTWAADYRFESVNGVTLQIPAHSFALPGGTVVDLTTMVKVPSSPGYGLPQAEAAAIRAEAAAQVALDVKAMADAGEFDGAQGPAGNATMRVDNTVGERIFITDGTTERMISGDTGWRDISTSLMNGWTGQMMIRRIGQTIFVVVANLNGSAATNAQFCPRFFGFSHPPLGASYALRLSDSTFGFISVTTAFFASPGIVGHSTASAISFATSDLWPATLPGTPA